MEKLPFFGVATDGLGSKGLRLRHFATFRVIARVIAELTRNSHIELHSY